MAIGLPTVRDNIGEPSAASEDHVGFDRNIKPVRAGRRLKRLADLPICHAMDAIIDTVDLKAATDREARGATNTHCDLVAELQ
jgi:hypothetical protein